jgi:hypothetical protein
MIVTALYPLKASRNQLASLESPLKNRGGALYSAPPSPRSMAWVAVPGCVMVGAAEVSVG